MEYENLFKMVNDILVYVGEHPGSVIICDDRPMVLLIGFTLRDADPSLSNNPFWYIKLRNLKVSVVKEGMPGRVREYFTTTEGRSKLASSLTEGINPLL
jgi:hypothetical protein